MRHILTTLSLILSFALSRTHNKMHIYFASSPKTFHFPLKCSVLYMFHIESVPCCNGTMISLKYTYKIFLFIHFSFRMLENALQEKEYVSIDSTKNGTIFQQNPSSWIQLEFNIVEGTNFYIEM